MILAAVALPDPRRITAGGAWEPEAYDASFDALRAAGIRHFELSRSRRLTPETAPAIRERAAARGLTAVALHAPSLHGPEVIARQLAVARAAALLGADVLVFHVSSLRFSSKDPEVRQAARAQDLERTRALAEFAGERGMRVGLENASHPLHPDYLLGLRETVGLPNVGVALDTGHANLRGTRARDAAAALAPAVVHTHLHDNHGARDEHLPPGHGTIDWPALASVLLGAGYDGAWCLELKGRPSALQSERLRQAAAFLRRLGENSPRRHGGHGEVKR